MASNSKKPQRSLSDKKSSTKGNPPPKASSSKKPPKKKYDRNESFTVKGIMRNTFDGLVIGSSMLVPGVSGGTMAIILGIYDELISAVSNIFKRFKHSFLLILQVAIGGITGIFLFSKLILTLIETYELPMMYLFMGAMLGSIPSLYKKGQVKKFNPLYFIWVIIGAGLVYALNFLPKGQFTVIPNDFKSYAMLFLCGLIIAIALVLPGISTSHILLVLGMYEAVWGAVNKLNFVYLLPIFLGVIVGIMLSTKILDKAMTCFPKQTYLLIIGFVLASLVDIFPGWPSGYSAVGCLGGAILGAGVVCLISK